MMKMQMKLLGDILDAVKAMRALAVESAERCSGIDDVASELLFEVADALIDEYGRDDAMRVLHSLSRSELEYDEFVAMTLNYREPIIGEETPDDWELPFYGMLMLTEPVFTTNEEEASDEGA